MALKRFIVSAHSTDAADLDALEARLREAGLQVTARLANVGVIMGSAEEDVAEGLQRVAGVAAIEEDRSVEAMFDDEDEDEDEPA